MSPSSAENEYPSVLPGEVPESPRHGFQGDRGAPAPAPTVPAALTITLSREAGARGATIGRRVSAKLGWQVYDQDLLEYMAQEAAAGQGVAEGLPPAALEWVETRVQKLLWDKDLSQHPSIASLARVVLGLGAQGEAVLIGRGAACILPRASSLHVRIVGPLEERVAYMSQWLRLTVEEAAEVVRRRDERRAEFVLTHFHRTPDDVHQYDMILDSSRLGEELCAELIAQAAKARSEQFVLQPGGRGL